MTSLPQESFSMPGRDYGEETLQLITKLTVPEGLVERVQAGLCAAPRRANLVHWPVASRSAAGLMRTAAAAAIVCVVAGGGWRIYSHLPVAPQVVVMPHRPGAAAPFGSAGAKRVPETLSGPVLIQPRAATAQAEPVKATLGPKAVSKPPAKGKKQAAPPAPTAPVH
jgi:hypothetical protein